MFANSANIIKPGDKVGAEIFYDASGKKIQMGVYDLTRAGAWNVGPIASVGGYPMTTYYDGNSTEFATEAPLGGSAPDGNWYLRKPHLGNTYFYETDSDYWYSNSSQLFWTKIYHSHNGSSSGYKIQSPTTLGSSGSFYTNYNKCD